MGPPPVPLHLLRRRRQRHVGADPREAREEVGRERRGERLPSIDGPLDEHGAVRGNGVLRGDQHPALAPPGPRAGSRLHAGGGGVSLLDRQPVRAADLADADAVVRRDPTGGLPRTHLPRGLDDDPQARGVGLGSERDRPRDGRQAVEPCSRPAGRVAPPAGAAAVVVGRRLPEAGHHRVLAALRDHRRPRHLEPGEAARGLADDDDNAARAGDLN
mmetsp:Transcript_6900/g.16644  ORF Transcript_6900/g.16644 Transcript_6900/m.16644 type:complete len:216 (+) Transcript_6900:505-1152(+)